ncbi:MAG: type III pantothenate kinase [Clostridia bacterium]|nr:type III pantothenate kinase [Clostridia bacterium]
MIFCIDIGNSNIKYAIFDGSEVKATFRVTSKRDATSDEYGVIVRDLLREAGIPKKSIKGVIMSSVIPSLNYTMEHMCRDYLGVEPLIIGPGVKTGLNIKADNPKEVGSDIIVDSVSAIKKLGKGTPIIAIDFGTATTFDVISERGELIGVVISPGIKSALDSLTNSTANLPRIELEKPKSVIGKNTVSCMQSGIIFGFSGLVDNIIAKIKEELKRPDTKVIATGGLGKIIFKETQNIDFYDPLLTLNGLRYIYEMNSAREDK